MLYGKSEKFDWDLYADSKKDKVAKFLGISFLKNEKSAKKRIKKLKHELKENHTVQLQMIELLWLIEKFENKISLGDDGIFEINKRYLFDFINSLSFDIETIEKMQNVEEEYLSDAPIEIDAKKLFFLMRNPKTTGFDNFQRNTHLFSFLNKNSNDVLLLEHISEDSDDIEYTKTVHASDDEFEESEGQSLLLSAVFGR